MYALFSKGFGKKATDMNKKEHVDKQANKVTVKGKTSTGVSYEMNVDPYNSCCADVAVTLPVDPKCDVKITNKSSKGVASNEVEALIKVASGMDLTLTFVGLDMEFKKTTVKGGFNYLNEQFSVETKFNVQDTKAVNKGLSLAFATDIPVEAAKGLKAGLQLSKSLDGNVMNILAALQYDQKDFSMTLKGNNFGIEGQKFSNPSMLGMYKVNAASSIAFEVANTTAKGVKDGTSESWTSMEAAGEAKNKITIGGDYKLNDTHKLKAKCDTDKNIGFGCVSTLGGGATLNTAIAISKETTFGMVYTLEA